MPQYAAGQLAGPCEPESSNDPYPPWSAPPADFGTVTFSRIAVTDSGGVTGGLANPHWTTDTIIQSGSPHTVAGPLLPAGFTDTWS